MKQTRLLILAILAVLALALLFTRSDALTERRSSIPEEGSAQVVVKMRAGAYVPATIRVKAGTTVVWKNEDQIPHTVTATDGSWDSGMIQPGGSYSRKFERTATAAFYCIPHPDMRGSVVVSP